MTTSYTGRVGSIVTAACRQGNDTNQVRMTDADCLQWINEALYDLAREGGFLKLGTFTSTANTETYAMQTLLTDFVALNNLVWAATKTSLTPAPSWSHYQQLREYTTSGTPLAYYLLGTTLYVWPPPDATTAGAFEAMYAYVPTALTGSSTSSGNTPPTAAGWDQYYVEYCLYREFQRQEADSYPRSKSKADEYYLRVVQLKNKILGRTRTPMFRITPYR
jgi:hypothetical protein